jgi:hypothetical protein
MQAPTLRLVSRVLGLGLLATADSLHPCNKEFGAKYVVADAMAGDAMAGDATC